MLLEASYQPLVIAHTSFTGDHICNWTIRASCDHVIEITLQNFNKTGSDDLFVSN